MLAQVDPCQQLFGPIEHAESVFGARWSEKLRRLAVELSGREMEKENKIPLSLCYSIHDFANSEQFLLILGPGLFASAIYNFSN